MKKTLRSASALALALAAAVASAQTTATATCSTVVTYTAPASVTVADVPGGTYGGRPVGQYDYGTPSYDDAGGATTLTHAGSTSFSQSGSTITITSNTSASLGSSNYAAVGNPAYMDYFLGYRYFLQFTNTSAVAQSVSFAFVETQGASVAAASPFGRADDLDGDGLPDTVGAFAASYQEGGIIDVTDLSNELYDTANDSAATSSFIATDGYTVPNDSGAGSTLLPGETRTYEFYATSESYAAFNPAPEPAPLTALVVGAVALLRRRRKA